MCVCVVVPTYNEAENIRGMLTQLLALPGDVRVVVVDDGSPDGTGALADGVARLRPTRVEVVHRPGKLGLGSAYLAGFSRAMALGARWILTMDADFSHAPAYIPEMVALGARGDLVIGSRYTPGGDARTMPYLRRALSRLANRLTHALLGIHARDVTTSFRLYRRADLESLPLDQIHCRGYAFLIELLYLAERRGWRVVEMPIRVSPRSRGRSKLCIHELLSGMATVIRLAWRGATPHGARPA